MEILIFVLVLCAVNTAFVFASFVILVIIFMNLGRINDMILMLATKKKIEKTTIDSVGKGEEKIE